MYYESFRDLSPFYSISTNVCSAHFHKSVELLYCFKNTKKVLVSNEEYILNEGDLLVVFPYEIHTFYPSESNTLCVAFPPLTCEKFITTVSGKKPVNRVIKNSEFTKDIFNHLTLIKNNVSEITMIGITNYVLGRILDVIPLAKNSGTNSDIIFDILSYIDKNYAENLTLESLAKQFGYSKYYFSTLFNAKLKVGVSQYVNSVRIRKSLSLLSKLTITEIAYKVGFNSTQQYYLNFKKILNTTPQKFMKTL